MGRSLPLLLCALLPAAAIAQQEPAPPPVDPPLQTGEQANRDAALIIGNEAYSALPQVVYAARDARSFLAWAEQTRGISRHRTSYLENATYSRMEREVRRAAGKVRSGGTLWIYFAGHGTASNDAAQRGLLGVDASPLDPSSRSLPLEEIAQAARKADRVVIIADAGFGNLGRDGLELVPGRQAPPLGPLPDLGPDVAVWLAEAGPGAAEGYPAAQHGVFTYLALGAMRGWADGHLDGQPDGKVTLQEAQRYVADTGRALGRPTRPSEDAREGAQGWLLAQGGQMEKGPSFEVLRALSLADRSRRFADREELLRAEAAAFWQVTLASVQKGGDEGRAALESFIAEYSSRTLSVEWVPHVPEVAQARQMLATYGQGGGPATPAAEPCDDELALEQPAMLGTFTSGQISCIEGRIRTARLQTDRNKLSRLLLVNAEAAGDIASWERLMARHLEEIDRSDPDLCFRYAIHLHKLDASSTAEHQEEAIRWANYALENKQVWTGEEFVKKVSGLYKLRAEAAAKLWKSAEEAYTREKNDETQEAAEDFRGLAKSYAREWLDYARASKTPTDRAYNLCLSAAGTDEYCRHQ